MDLAEWIKYFVYKHVDLNLNSLHPHNRLGMAGQTLPPGLASMMGNPKGSLAISRQSHASCSVKNAVSKNEVPLVIEEDISVSVPSECTHLPRIHLVFSILGNSGLKLKRSLCFCHLSVEIKGTHF